VPRFRFPLFVVFAFRFACSGATFGHLNSDFWPLASSFKIHNSQLIIHWDGRAAPHTRAAARPLHHSSFILHNFQNGRATFPERAASAEPESTLSTTSMTRSSLILHFAFPPNGRATFLQLLQHFSERRLHRLGKNLVTFFTRVQKIRH
jgi:hypothetical protein